MPCSLEVSVLHEFPENCTAYNVYEKVVELDILVEVLVTQSNLYAKQCGINFTTSNEEMKAFIGINYIMSLNNLPTINMYWDSDDFVGNEGIRNVISRQRFKDILQNLHFTDMQMLMYQIKVVKYDH